MSGRGTPSDPRGGERRAHRHRAGAGAARACLDELGIGRIDLLVLTHYDLDHVGGVDAVVGRVDRVLVGPRGCAATPPSRRARGGRRRRRPGRARERGMLGELSLARCSGRRRAASSPATPRASTLDVQPGAACARGCLSAPPARRPRGGVAGPPARRAALGPVDVVKVAHHGSADQRRALRGAPRDGRPHRGRRRQRLRPSDRRAARHPGRDRHGGRCAPTSTASCSSRPAPSRARSRSGRARSRPADS